MTPDTCEETPTSGLSAPARPNKTIVVVEDSPFMRSGICNVLRTAGYVCIEAEDGADALAKMAGRPVHLVISDVNMPNMDGITFVRELKKLDAYRFTPVVMLSAEASESKRLKGLLAGATVWVVKPIGAEEMLATISRLALP